MADAIRLFVEASLHEGAAVAATPGQAHRLGTVMRRGVGDAVRLFNGRDGEWDGRIAAPGQRRGQVTILAERLRRPQAAEPGPALLFAPLKRAATDLLAEKATELGASRLQPVITARTVAQRVAVERLALIAVEAAEQCERLTVPAVQAPRPLADVIALWPPELTLAAAIERLNGPGIAAPAAGLLVGPEGGFTGAELDLLRSRPFVVPVSLGPRILRAETAAIAGLALLQAHGTAAAAPERAN
jgi:16S rRNA (uracil1498-N3)-methyltransferase